MACRGSLCICCIIFLTSVSAILTILIILSYVGVEPRFYIQQIYIPALDSSLNSTNIVNTSIFMDLKFKRVVAFAPIRYEDLNITLQYYGSIVVPGFYQGRKKTARRRVVVSPPWEDAIRNISSTVALVVELTTKYRLRECDGDGDCSFTKAKGVVVAADVAMDVNSGEMVSHKPIRLR